MRGKISVLAVLVFFGFLFSGCAAGRKESELETQGLKNRVLALQAELQNKDEEINALKKESLSGREESSEVKGRPKIKQIQLALKNAGYNPVTMDGKMGKETREAIKSFQKANGLKPDGKAGKRTWILLKKYLAEKVK